MRHIGVRRSSMYGCALVGTCVLVVASGASAGSSSSTASSAGKTASGLCATGDALTVNKQINAARKAYVDALRADPAAAKDCAEKGFAALSPKTTKPKTKTSRCAKGDALRHARQDSAAKSEYVAVLKKNITEKCAKNALRHRSAATALSDVLGAIVTFVLALLAWAAALAAVAAVTAGVLSRFTAPRRQIVKVAWLDRLLAPRLVLQDLKDGAAPLGTGAGLTALVRAELAATASVPATAARYRLDRLTGREELTTALGAVEELSPSLKVAAAVLGLVRAALPRARFTASGALQVDGGHGEGTTVALDGGTEPVAATLWVGPTIGRANDEGAAFQPLAVPVGAWIDFEVRAALDESPPAVNATSYALLQGGLASERRGDGDTALRLYGGAVQADPGNVSAIVNLANLRARGREEYLGAVATLEQALATLHVSS